MPRAIRKRCSSRAEGPAENRWGRRSRSNTACRQRRKTCQHRRGIRCGSDEKIPDRQARKRESEREKKKRAPDTEFTLKINDGHLKEAIDGMSTAGTPGPDGLRPSHIKQMTGALAINTRDRTFNELKRFVYVCMKGSIPLSVEPLFFGATFGSKKKGRRDPANCSRTSNTSASHACGMHYQFIIKDKAIKLLEPFILGVGSRGGAESETHSTRRFLSNSDEHSCIVKLDFSQRIQIA